MFRRRDDPGVGDFSLVEVAGVAGSGKTTLASSLATMPGHGRDPFISARDPGQLLRFAISFPRLLPLLIQNLRMAPRMTWADYKLLVYITTGARHLSRQADRGVIYIADQGPIYALVRLKAKDLGVATSHSFDSWWLTMLDHWLARVDLVVWLDAPDDTLLDRINQRPQQHAIKDGNREEGIRFIQRYRELFNEVSEQMERRGRRVAKFDTSLQSSDEIRDAVAASINPPAEG